MGKQKMIEKMPTTLGMFNAVYNFFYEKGIEVKFESGAIGEYYPANLSIINNLYVNFNGDNIDNAEFFNSFSDYDESQKKYIYFEANYGRFDEEEKAIDALNSLRNEKTNNLVLCPIWNNTNEYISNGVIMLMGVERDNEKNPYYIRLGLSLGPETFNIKQLEEIYNFFTNDNELIKSLRKINEGNKY